MSPSAQIYGWCYAPSFARAHYGIPRVGPAPGARYKCGMNLRRVVICGAAGRDFHNFNMVYRDDPYSQVVAFTAAQIPGIEGRRYPPLLAGEAYPTGIPIVAEDTLEDLIRERNVDTVVFAYSDVTHAQVMHVAARALAAGANFELLGPAATCIPARKRVVGVSAVRTGCGKSQIARHVASRLRGDGRRVVSIRHPMPYGDLARQRTQRFASMDDIASAQCTFEEREEYEAHVAEGGVVYAGVDYEAILRRAQQEADVVVWDGGNNDFPFVRTDLHIVVVDALRPDQLATHYPGEAVLRMADVVVLNKVNAATDEQREIALEGIREIVPSVPIVEAASPVTLDVEAVRGKRVLIVEDGPTITHGGMPYGAAFEAVKHLDVEIIDPRESAHPAIRAVYDRYPHIGRVLPAMGYGRSQIEALTQTIDASVADVVVAGTPIDLAHDASLQKPVVRVRYQHEDLGEPTLMSFVERAL